MTITLADILEAAASSGLPANQIQVHVLVENNPEHFQAIEFHNVSTLVDGKDRCESLVIHATVDEDE